MTIIAGLMPTYVLAFRNRGFTHYAEHEFDRAIADYDVAIRLDPKNIPAYNDRGNIYQAKGDVDRAIADFSEAIRLNPSFAPLTAIDASPITPKATSIALSRIATRRSSSTRIMSQPT